MKRIYARRKVSQICPIFLQSVLLPLLTVPSMQDLYQTGKNAIPLTVTDNNLFINICWILWVKVMFQPKKNVALTRVLVSAPRKFLRFTAWMAEQAFLSSWKKKSKIKIIHATSTTKTWQSFASNNPPKVSDKSVNPLSNPVSHYMVISENDPMISPSQFPWYLLAKSCKKYEG